jgi:hypothetical protein
MSRYTWLAVLLPVALLLLSQVGLGSSSNVLSLQRMAKAEWAGGLIADHACLDLNSIPTEWVESAQMSLKVHYAHTSHGSQVITGLDLIEEGDFSFSQTQGDCFLPTESHSLCILDGNPPNSYVTPDLYWETPEGLALTQATLDDNPSLTVSIWSWCTQLNDYNEEQTQAYLDAMSSLEEANPDVTFVYMTGNAQATGAEGYNRWLRNEQIRQFCSDGGRVLFDFADLDCWSNGEHSTYSYTTASSSYSVPVEHEDFHGDQAGHTTYASCEQKARAFWWLMARLAGWNAQNTDSTTTSVTTSSVAGPYEYGGTLLLGGSLLVGLTLVTIIVYRYKH